MKSSSMVARTIGCAKTKRSPSRAAAHVMRVRGPGPRAHQQQRRDHHQERERVDGIHPGDPRARDHEAGERRSQDGSELEHQGVEPDGAGEMLAGHEVGDERLPSGTFERGRRRGQGSQEVDRPHGAQPAEGESRERRGEKRHDGLRGEHHLAAVQRVRHHAREQREPDDRYDLGGADEPQCQRFAPRRGEERDVPQNGRRLHPRSGKGQQLPDPEQREIAVPQGRKRGGDAAEGHTRKRRRGRQLHQLHG
jgi:hypothetical protein